MSLSLGKIEGSNLIFYLPSSPAGPSPEKTGEGSTIKAYQNYLNFLFFNEL